MSRDFSRYKWNLRILLVETPSRKHSKYIAARKEYDSNLQKYHSHYVKFITQINKSLEAPTIKLVGFDGGVKRIYNTLTTSKVMADIASMPMGDLVRPKNMSLYSDYHPASSVSGLGFKNAVTAKRTIRTIKNKKVVYQKQVIDTMIGRAKHHPHQTSKMRNAIRILEQYKKKLASSNHNRK
jgi:hypothetical protein